MKAQATLLVAVLVASSCTTTKSSLTGLAPSRWASELRQRGVDPDRVPDPLRVTDEMRRAATAWAGTGHPDDRLSRLQDALFDPAKFPFTYQTRGTFTAAEAFYRREGNCLSFTNLFVALARSVGIPATTALVLRVRGSERDGDLIVVNTHVVATYAYGGTNLIYDFQRSRKQQPTAIRTLDDIWITALYLNNRGADELRAGRVDSAAWYFENTVKLAPTFGPGWGNLGVARRRLGDSNGAFEAYRRALELDADNPTILSNLAALYASLGRMDEANAAVAATNLSKASPHLLLVRGYLALSGGDRSEARKLFRRARRLASDNPDPLVALARYELAVHNSSKAVRYLNDALRIQPGNTAATNLLATIRRNEERAAPAK